MALSCQANGPPPGFVDGTDGAVTEGGAEADGAGGDAPLGRDAIPVRDTGTAVLTPDAACMTTTADARRVPLNLLILLDRSGSMGQGSRPTKWESAVAGIQRLLTRLGDDARVGLTLFPARSGAAGSPDGYTSPAVPVAPLRMSRGALVTALGGSPSGNTPMVCAAQGTLGYYSTGFTLEGSRNVILITDGAPTQECLPGPACAILPFPDLECLLRQERVARDAVSVAVAMGARLSPPVRWYIAGTPEASDAFLSSLAVTGGTPRTPTCRESSSCHYSLRSASFERDLDMALEEIRGRALTCEFEVNADSGRVDPTRVNVNFTGTGQPTPRLIPRDVDHRDGWDYANGMRTVVLHGAACDRVRMDPMARVQILFGCPTVTPG